MGEFQLTFSPRALQQTSILPLGFRHTNMGLPVLQMTKNRRTISDNRPASDDSEEESDENGKFKSATPSLLAPTPRRP